MDSLDPLCPNSKVATVAVAEYDSYFYSYYGSIQAYFGYMKSKGLEIWNLLIPNLKGYCVLVSPKFGIKRKEKL